MFANAGTAEFIALENVDEAHVDRMFDGNVKGVLFTVQKALPLMPKGSAVVLTGSIAGCKGRPTNSVYAATKAAIRSFARTWTSDLKDRKIRVNVVSPGPVDTPGLRGFLGSAAHVDERLQAMAQSIPLGRLAHAHDVARAVLFLASSDSSYVTGAELFVDGGTAQI